MMSPKNSSRISFLDLPREIRQKILKQNFAPQMSTTARPISQAIFYPSEEMNSRWSPIKKPDRAKLLTAEMQFVEDWVKEKHRIGNWHEKLVGVDPVVGEDMRYVADQWYEELSILFGMLRFENLGKKFVSQGSSRSRTTGAMGLVG